ncbi:hypothetical protein GCM10022252_64950 [Streptosporangium oxazolinicum]|uniref:Type II restriction enzyme NaeI domain-containing protein n=2 Tax=Streptosporangium oxazolinicum TaxID=909287 RepID=A0ABP8BEQ6_9ACTN
MEIRFGEIFRQSIDEVLDGQRTGRFDLATTAKTEKTYLGTKVEILCQVEFNLQRGTRMDYLVNGHEVDAKFSSDGPTKQSIPREAVGHICLLMHADDADQFFSVGLLRVTSDVLSPGKGNQDGKKAIIAAGRPKVLWLVRQGQLPENLLLNLPEVTRRAIFDVPVPKGRGKGGQKRVNQLFRLVQRRAIRREVVLAVAQQDDGPKRVRDARSHLRPEGILVLGHQDDHPRIARDLKLPVPNKGQWVSVRVVPQGEDFSRPGTLIQGVRYVVAMPDEAPVPGPTKIY